MKNRHTVWMTDETWSEVKSHYRGDNCSTQNEYIEKAIGSTPATWIRNRRTATYPV